MVISRWLTSERQENAAVYFRKTFSVRKCKDAYLEITALGWFKAYVNGVEASDGEFLPGWTDYNRRMPVFRFDVLPLLRKNNALGVVVGKGWAAGSACWGNFEKYYDVKTPCLYARIVWTDIDGKSHATSADGWKFSYGRIRENDLMFGETQDYFANLGEYACAEYDDSAWKKAVYVNRSVEAEENRSPRVCAHEKFEGKSVAKKVGYELFDFSQNFAGVTRIKVVARGNCKLVVRHGEALDKRGELYRENLRTAKAEDVYLLPPGEYELRPEFTYHGFRYAACSYEGDLEIRACEGLAIYADLRQAGKFETSDSLVNQIASNCLWSLKSNFLYVPTDCPQRDERLGWLGDVGVFARSAMYMVDCRAFFERYLAAIAEATREDGAIPAIAPVPKWFLDNAIGAAAWADAFLEILNDHYDFYGDKAAVERYFPTAKKFVEWVESNSEEYRRKTYCFSDWLSLNADLKEGCGDVDFQVFDLCFYALDCLLMKKFCRVLGMSGREYDEKHARAKRFFKKRLLGEDDAPIGGGRQTALLLAYEANLLDGEAVRATLVEDVKANGITCGFIGVKYLLPVLTELGEAELCYDLITRTSYPSWGYSVVNGATSVWERWDSYTKDGGFHSAGMNSFNHFAFASCAEWFYSGVLGIKMRWQGDGVVLSPRIDWSGRLTSAKGWFATRWGKVSVEWETDGRRAIVCVKMPENLFCEFDFDDCRVVDGKRDKATAKFVLER